MKQVPSSSCSYFQPIQIHNKFNSSINTSKNSFIQSNTIIQSFSSFVEKYNSKLNMWYKLYMIIEKNYLFLYEKKPLNQNSQYKEFFILDNKITISFHQNFRKGSTNKLYVISFRMNSKTLSRSNIEDDTYNIFIALKTSILFEKVKSVLENILKCNINLNEISVISPLKKNKNKTPIISLKKNKSLFTFAKENNEPHVLSKSKINRFEDEENLNEKKIKTQRNKINNLKKFRTQSCFELQKRDNDGNIIQTKKNTLNHKRVLSPDLIISQEETLEILDNKKNNNEQYNIQTLNCFFTGKNNYNNLKENKQIFKEDDLSELNYDEENENNQSLNNLNLNESEQNTTLISLLSKMVSSNKKIKKKKINYLSKIKKEYNNELKKENENFQLCENIIEDNISNQKNKIDKIVDITLINEKNSNYIEEDYSKSTNTSLIIIPQQKNNNNNKKKDLEITSNKIIDINSSTFGGSNTSRSVSGDEEILTLGNSDNHENNLLNLIYLIDTYQIYIYDSSILKSILKGIEMKSKDLGKFFSLSQNPDVKSFYLCEMIAILSKKFLKQSIIKSLEVVLREKELNKDYIITPNNPHSIEYCICDVFNTFLSQNIENYYKKILYKHILPNYLKSYFNIEIKSIELNDYMKNKISIHTLFTSMQHHNRIYFFDNLKIDFSPVEPFKSEIIKYISPYYITLWHIKAKDTEVNVNDSIFYNNNNNNYITTTNIKNIKSKIGINEIDKIDELSSLEIFKQYDVLKDKRKINLINSIYNSIINKNFENALKLCDDYIQQFTNTIFNNSIVYMDLAQIYNELNGIDYAKMFFEKSLFIINWLFPLQNCYILFELHYKYLLILMKQNQDYIKENKNEIINLINKCEELSKRFYKKIIYKVGIQKIIYEMNFVLKENQSEVNEEEIWKLYNNVNLNMDDMRKRSETNLNNQNFWKEEMLYWDLFIDLFKYFCNCPNDIISDFLQKMYYAKKKYDEFSNYKI